MEGKDNFTEEELADLRVLIKSFSRANTSEERKSFRGKFRKKGFYVSDFGIQNIDISQFESLIQSGRIIATSGENKLVKKKLPISQLLPEIKKEIQFLKDLEKNLIKGTYKPAEKLESNINLDCTGFYSIRLKNGNSLPLRYQNHLNKRNSTLIYLGKAEGQTLRKRLLGQELRAKGHGTFFRSIGAVLGFCPEKGSLLPYKNKKNYKFCLEDEKKIIVWINKNLEVNWTAYSGDFSIEKELIKKFTPLLNDTHNPLKLMELIEDKAKCRAIANTQN